MFCLCLGLCGLASSSFGHLKMVVGLIVDVNPTLPIVFQHQQHKCFVSDGQNVTNELNLFGAVFEFVVPFL